MFDPRERWTFAASADRRASVWMSEIWTNVKSCTGAGFQNKKPQKRKQAKSETAKTADSFRLLIGMGQTFLPVRLGICVVVYFKNCHRDTEMLKAISDVTDRNFLEAISA